MTTVSTTIALPLTEAQAQAVSAAALAFGVDSWELGVHILKLMLELHDQKKINLRTHQASIERKGTDA